MRQYEPVGQVVSPGGIVGLQHEQLGDSVMPSLWPGAPVSGPSVADCGAHLLGLPPKAMAGLSFGIAERVLAFRLSPFRHSLTSVT